MNNGIGKIYRFGEFRFDAKKQKLWRQDELIPLPMKSLELLSLLLETKGEFVSREEIFNRIWTDTFVEDGVLTQNIYTLRKVLGSDSDGLPIIENKKKFGYRLTIPVSISSDSEIIENVSKIINLDEKNVSSKNYRLLWLIPALILLIAAISFVGWRFFNSKSNVETAKSTETIKFTKFTDSGKLINATISPDGEMLAFVSGNNIFLKDAATKQEVKLDVPNIDSFGSLQFSSDGNFLYFRDNKKLSVRAAIQKTSKFGGTAQAVIDKSWGSFSLSPDGKNIAYFLNVPPIAKFNLIIKNLESGEEKEFFAVEQPNSLCLNCSPAWTQDGKKVLIVTNRPNATGQLFVADAESGQKEEIKINNLKRFEQAVWQPDGQSFIVSATEGGKFMHLWKVAYPSGEATAITNGLISYGKVATSSDGKKLLALQTILNTNLYVADHESLNQPKQLTFGNQNYVGQQSLDWIGDEKIIFSKQTETDLTEHLSVIDSVGNNSLHLTEGRQDSSRLPTNDGKFIWFVTNKNSFANIYQMDIDGKNVKQITDGKDGQRQSPQISNDGNYLYYVFRSKIGGNIRRFDLKKQVEEIVFDNPEFQPGPFLELSADNKFITFTRVFEQTEANADKKYDDVMTIVSLESKSDVKTMPISMITRFRRFSPDNKALEWISAESDGSQIVRQAFDATESKPIYTIADGTIFNFAWSRNGKKLAVSQGTLTKDAVVITNFE